MDTFGAELREQSDETAARVERRTEERRSRIEVLAQPNGMALADTPERVATRIDRLSRYYPELAGVSAEAVAAAEPAAIERAGQVLEAIIGTEDFVGVRYLEAGAAAAKAVGRINIRNARGRLAGYGTGSLVSAELLLTNHHVLPDAAAAATSQIEFDYQDGVDGRPLQPVLFGLDPERFFVADKSLDFALVAVKAAPGELARFSYNRLVESEGKAIVGDFVTIVQHPGGEKKQVALRENRIVDITSVFLHYETDTEPGSSGSPVFNDQWEIVALHHASVPAPGHDELGGLLNEGIRISSILRHVRAQDLGPDGRLLVDRLLGTAAPAPVPVTALPSAPVVTAGPAVPLPGMPEPVTGSVPVVLPAPVLSPPAVTPPTPVAAPVFAIGDGPGTVGTAPGGGPVVAVPEVTAPAAGSPDGGVVRVTVPVEVTLRAGTASPTTSRGRVDLGGLGVGLEEAERPGPAAEGISIDPDYGNREGFDPAFLGGGPHLVPLPELAPELLAAAALATSGPEPRHVLPYHHFSVIMSAERRLAFCTSVNIDGTTSVRLRRDRDRWSFDPRLPRDQQTGEEVYRSNPLDRGHLVRRLDPAWGAGQAEAKRANDDTFHFTNCTPQHEDFNQNQTTWAGLEDYVLENADNRDLRVSVHTGPVLAADDEVFKDVALPRQFWKVVAMVRRDGALSATAYLLSQASLLEGLESTEFSYGAYETFQVTVRRVEQLTRLSFGPLAAADPLARLEVDTTVPRAVTGPEDLVL